MNTHVDYECYKISITLTNVGNHDEKSVNEITFDSLCCSPVESYQLTAFAFKKIMSNPFFVHQMIETLCEQILINFYLRTYCSTLKV